MPLRILIIALTLIFIAGCESDLDKCITANLAKAEMNTIKEFSEMEYDDMVGTDWSGKNPNEDLYSKIFKSQEYIQFGKIIEEINDDPDRKPSQKEFREMEYKAMRAGLKSIQEREAPKEARLARISAENFCNLQGIY